MRKKEVGRGRKGRKSGGDGVGGMSKGRGVG